MKFAYSTTRMGHLVQVVQVGLIEKPQKFLPRLKLRGFRLQKCSKFSDSIHVGLWFIGPSCWFDGRQNWWDVQIISWIGKSTPLNQLPPNNSESQHLAIQILELVGTLSAVRPSEQGWDDQITGPIKIKPHQMNNSDPQTCMSNKIFSFFLRTRKHEF